MHASAQQFFHHSTAAFRCLSHRALELVYPPLCGICRLEPVLPEEGYLCGTCRDNLIALHGPFCLRCGQSFPAKTATLFQCDHCRDIPIHFDWSRSALRATPHSLDLVHRLKYTGSTWLARPLARILVDACFSASVVSPAGSGSGTAMGAFHGWNLVVPVPLHRSRLAERGYNQAALLAREIARQLQVPHTQAAVRRSRPTLSQTSLGRTQRLSNVRGVFSPGRGSGSVAGQNVLLVDDVMTTGATLSECAAVLKKVGARSVGVVSVVRGHYRV